MRYFHRFRLGNGFPHEAAVGWLTDLVSASAIAGLVLSGDPLPNQPMLDAPMAGKADEFAFCC
jgi:hypothetical protein